MYIAEVSLMFSAGGQLAFTSRQNYRTELLYKKNFRDGQTSLAKLSSLSTPDKAIDCKWELHNCEHARCV